MGGRGPNDSARHERKNLTATLVCWSVKLDRDDNLKWAERENAHKPRMLLCGQKATVSGITAGRLLAACVLTAFGRGLLVRRNIYRKRRGGWRQKLYANMEPTKR